MEAFIRVILWGQEVGRLGWHERRKLTYFHYHPDFLHGKLDIAPLVASIHNPTSTRTIFGETEHIYQKLPSFIADALPDAWGNLLFEQWRKEQQISGRSLTPLEKLSFIGQWGIGALEFIPETERRFISEKINIKLLADLARQMAEKREQISLQSEEVPIMQALIAIGTPAGGRQPKIIIAMNPQTGEVHFGQIEPETDFLYYLLKFGNKERSSAELEQTYYEMALDAGITMMESCLWKVEDTEHFLTKRFDRDASGKLHTQTLAAMDPTASSYESLLTVCQKLHLPESDSQEVFCRMIFNILANNTDDHNKNFTFIMDRKGTWRLSPAYDMTFIFDAGGFRPDRRHCLTISGKVQDISRTDVLSLASQFGIQEPESIIRKVVRSVRKFRELAKKNRVRDEWIGRIESCINGHLSAWGYESNPQSFSYKENGYEIKNAFIEPAYKGNYHLLATINGKAYKYILRTGTKEYDAITAKGLSNITEDTIKKLVQSYLLPKTLS